MAPSLAHPTPMSVSWMGFACWAAADKEWRILQSTHVQLTGETQSPCFSLLCPLATGPQFVSFSGLTPACEGMLSVTGFVCLPIGTALFLAVHTTVCMQTFVLHRHVKRLTVSARYAGMDRYVHAFCSPTSHTPNTILPLYEGYANCKSACTCAHAGCPYWHLAWSGVTWPPPHPTHSSATPTRQRTLSSSRSHRIYSL